MCSPVVLFVYNRPTHTRKVIAALSNCTLAQDTDLIIFSDSAKEKKGGHHERVLQVRSEIKNIKGFRNTTIIERSENFGLGKSIITGLEEVFLKYDRVIVLEDDLIPHRDFLFYCNYYLNLYEKDTAIWHISGFQKDCWLQFLQPQVFLTRFMNCSGWATWKDRWEQLIVDNTFFDNYLANPVNKTSFDYHKLEHSAQFELNRDQLKTWAIYWYGTIQAKNGLCINPKFSFVQNIGDDGTGSNMGVSAVNKSTNKPVKNNFGKLTRASETFIDRIFIREAYAKRSRVRLKTIKNFLFTAFTGLRRTYYKLLQVESTYR